MRRTGCFGPPLLVSALCACCYTAIAQESDLLQRLEQAKTLTMETLGAPVKTVRIGRTMLVPNPDKITWDILQVYFTHYGGPNEIVIIDGVSGKIQHIHIPAKPYRMQWHMCPSVIAPNGKLFIATGGKTQFIHIYDAADNSFKERAIELPSEFTSPAHGHPMTLGLDGKIYYAAAYGKGRFGACQIDPDTLKVTNYGAVGDPAFGKNLPWSIASDKRYVYVVGAKMPWSLAVYDKQTGTSQTLFNSPSEMSVKQTPFGCTFTAHGKNGGLYWMDDGKAISSTSTPPAWVEQSRKDANVTQIVPLPPKPEVFTKQAEPGSDGKCVLWVRSVERCAKEGEQSQEANVHETPEAAGWKAYRYTVETAEMRIQRLVEMPDGRIFGTGGGYGGQFIFDPVSNESTFMGKAHVNVYAISTHDGNVYFSGYPSSATFVYDPGRTWTLLPGGSPPGVISLAHDDPKQNPRFIGYLTSEAGTHKMYASAVGADGCIYFGGRWMRNGSGGGLAWYDPRTQKKTGLSEIFSNYQIRYMTTTDKGRYIVISTIPQTDVTHGKQRPQTGRLFVFDTTSKTIINSFDPVPECEGTGTIVGVDGTDVIGLSYQKGDRNKTVLYRVNAKSEETVFKHTIDIIAGLDLFGNEVEPFDFRLGPDNKIWTYLDRLILVRIEPRTGEIDVVGKVPWHCAGRMGFSGKDLYLSNEFELRRISDIFQPSK